MPRRWFAGLVVVALLAGLDAIHGQSGGLTIAAASDLQTVFPQLVRGFERASGMKATVTFGSSGNFFAQIQNGAPYDLYFSADIDYPRRLGASGHADAKTLYAYAAGRIVLWTRKDSGIDVKPGLSVLRDVRVRRVAIANPTHAPYGRAAVAAMRAQSVYAAAAGKIVTGEHISQAAQLADSGSADVAIIALSLALGPALSNSGNYFEVPAAMHPAIEQGAIVVSGAKNRAAAERFLTYVKGPDAQALLRKFGFTTPVAAR